MCNALHTGLGLSFALCFGLAFAHEGGAAHAPAAAPTEEVVRQYVTRRQEKLTKSSTGPKSVTVTFESIRFGTSRKANARDEFDGIPKGETVYPVRVKYTAVYHWGSGDEEKQIHYDYEFYKDNYGEWAALGLGPVR